MEPRVLSCSTGRPTVMFNTLYLYKLITYTLLLGLLALSSVVSAQRGNPIRGGMDRVRGLGGALSGQGGKDSLQRRDANEDSITISYKYFDSTRTNRLDSSVADMPKIFPLRATDIYIGNIGSATRSVLFSPVMQAGWDAGFHAYDRYNWTLNDVRFFTVTRPYSEIFYMLGSKSEQQIALLHTQNIKPNWNVLGQFRMITAPGYFNSQKNSHNNYLVSSSYESVNKRYHNYFAVVANNVLASENGGIQDTADFLNNRDFKDRFVIPTKIGGQNEFIGGNFFNKIIKTGNKYKTLTAMMRQQYDFGKKDSLVTDSSVVPLFFPRLRFEHTIQYNTHSYEFYDSQQDSAYFRDLYDINLARNGDTFFVKDSWRDIVNSLSIYQFPDAKNLHQFIKVGASVQNLVGDIRNGKSKFYNIIGYGEYRNRTRNQRWDIEANGRVYFAGLNAGDYEAHISLLGFLSKKLGYAKVGFENVNRTPSFLYNPLSNFNLLQTGSFRKENNTHIYAQVNPVKLGLLLSGHLYLVTNYTYLTGFNQLEQSGTPFNVLQVALNKTFSLGRKKTWKWHTDIYVQQVIGNAPVNVPLVFTRNRFGYEGNLGFKNLALAVGVDLRYQTPYKADAYSPLLGKFQYQDTTTIKNLPDIGAYVNFRIKKMTVYARADNLNTVSLSQGFGFTNNNLAAINYPTPGFLLRVGLLWRFVN
jgi:hypothetical protein